MAKFFDHLEEWLISLLMAAATLLIFTAVVHRYASGVPAFFPYLSRFDTSWAQELCIYMFVWMAKFGAAYGVRTGVHVGVDLLVHKLEPRRQKPIVLFGLACGVFFTALIGTLGAHMVWKISHTQQTSPDLEVPMWLVYLCIPLGSYLMSFRFLQVMVSYARTGKLPRHEPIPIEELDVHPAGSEATGHPIVGREFSR
ncbi:MAG: TRAP transporter small permease [Magnetococcales bacterium]|nr:TRAP transporter small permease [Magnetococcales bacterium]MBF0114966.1 TRAP transporter small permease [Magnetococcales bacterium]